jgi:hypothetical protein
MMERLTRQSRKEGPYLTDRIAGEHPDGGYHGEAVEKLARFENLYEDLLEKKKVLRQDLEDLVKNDRLRTYEYTERYAEKLMNDALLELCETHGLK